MEIKENGYKIIVANLVVEPATFLLWTEYLNHLAAVFQHRNSLRERCLIQMGNDLINFFRKVGISKLISGNLFR